MSLKWAQNNQVKWVGVQPGVYGTQVLEKIILTANGVLYTVPAAKVLLLFDWFFGTIEGATTRTQLQVRDGAAAIQGYLLDFDPIATFPGQFFGQSLYMPIELIATWDLYVQTAVALRGYIHGILIDV